MLAVAIDLETTGLDPNTHAITEIGGLVFDTQTGQKHEVFRCYVNPEGMVWSAYCLRLHWRWLADVLDRLNQKDTDGYTFSEEGRHPIMDPSVAIDRFIGWYRMVCTKHQQKLMVVGKNFGRFDWRFLNANGVEDGLFPVRSLDPAILFMGVDDTRPPDLQQCLDRAGITRTVKHGALADCHDVADALVYGLSHCLKDASHVEARYKQMEEYKATIEELQRQCETLQKRNQDLESLGAEQVLRADLAKLGEAVEVHGKDIQAMRARYIETCDALNKAHAKIEQLKSVITIRDSSIAALARLHDEKAEELDDLHKKHNAHVLETNDMIIKHQAREKLLREVEAQRHSAVEEAAKMRSDANHWSQRALKAESQLERWEGNPDTQSEDGTPK